MNPQSNQPSESGVAGSPNTSPPAQGGLLSKAGGLASGVFSLGATVVGAGVGSVKWAASTTAAIGGGIVSKTANVGGTVLSTAKSYIPVPHLPGSQPKKSEKQD